MNEHWFLMKFRHLEMKEGHILWPRFARSGTGYFVCKVPHSLLEQTSSTNASHQIAGLLWKEALEKRFYEFREPELTAALRLDALPDVPEVLQLVQNLMKSNASYILSVNPPREMSEHERSEYARLGF